MLGLCKTHLGLKDILYKEAHMEYTLESVIKQKKEKKKDHETFSLYNLYIISVYFGSTDHQIATRNLIPHQKINLIMKKCA